MVPHTGPPLPCHPAQQAGVVPCTGLPLPSYPAQQAGVVPRTGPPLPSHLAQQAGVVLIPLFVWVFKKHSLVYITFGITVVYLV